ncbi:MAG: hypothetical protein AB1648_15560 [Pseudomonadota bacterium]
MNIHQAVRTECVVGEALVAALPELRRFLGKRTELIALDLQPVLENRASHHPKSEMTAQANEPGPDAVSGQASSQGETCETLLAENQELRRRLRTLRDAMRLTDWMLLQNDYPEMREWFDD